MSSTWLNIDELNALHLAPNLINWLTRPQRLSKTLQHCLPNWHIEVLTQALWHLSVNEAEALHCLPGESAWVREICHYADSAIVYGRVTVPAPTYQALKHELGELKDKPIGDTLLFNNPKVSRSGFSYASIPRDHPDYHEAFTHFTDQALWARRSVFHWQALPLLVTELFPAQLPDYPEHFHV